MRRRWALALKASRRFLNHASFNCYMFVGLDALLTVSGIVHVDRPKVPDISLKRYHLHLLVQSQTSMNSQDAAVGLSGCLCVPSQFCLSSHQNGIYTTCNI